MGADRKEMIFNLKDYFWEYQTIEYNKGYNINVSIYNSVIHLFSRGRLIELEKKIDTVLVKNINAKKVNFYVEHTGEIVFELSKHSYYGQINNYKLSGKFGHVYFKCKGEKNAPLLKQVVECSELDFYGLSIATYKNTIFIINSRNPEQSLAFNNHKETIYLNFGWYGKGLVDYQAVFLHKASAYIKKTFSINPVPDNLNIDLTGLPQDSHEFFLVDTYSGKGYEWMTKTGVPIGNLTFPDFKSLGGVMLKNIGGVHDNRTEFLTIMSRPKVKTKPEDTHWKPTIISYGHDHKM